MVYCRCVIYRCTDFVFWMSWNTWLRNYNIPNKICSLKSNSVKTIGLKTKMKTQKFIFPFIALLSSSNARFLLAEDIGTAFGVTLGKPFPENIPTTSIEKDGPILFHFLKPVNVKYINTVGTVSFSDSKTNYVCQINGFGKSDSKVERDEAFQILKKILSSKYKSETSETEESLLKNEFSIKQGSRYVSIKSKTVLKDFPKSYQIDVSYSDEILAKHLMDAHMQKKVTETKSESF